MQGRAPAHIIIPWPTPTRKSRQNPTGSQPAASTMNRITRPPTAMKAMEKRNSRAIFARARAGLLTGTVIRFFSVSLSCSSKSRLEASTTRAGMSSR